MKKHDKSKSPSRNMRIRTRVFITTLLAVFLPVAISVAGGFIFEEKIKSYLSYNSVNTPSDVVNIIFGKIGFILIGIVTMYIISIIVFSFITSRAITKPIEELAHGVNEIANGNTSYIINYDSNNEIGTTVKAFNEMTAQMLANEEERQRMEQSRKQLINGIAHDLRTPLTSIKGYVEGLRDGIADTPEKQQRYLRTIYTSTLDMEKMLDDLLSLSRLETGNIDIITQPVDVVAMMQDYVDEFTFDLEKEGFTCHLHKPESDSIIVDLDCDRFYRVLVNIISNSIKYAKKNIPGEINIEIKDFESNVIISITDNGIGIEPENLEHIFDTFFRADVARTRVRNGSGIGLSVCKLIVEKHGGRIWATSIPDEGTTIHISLNKSTEKQDEKANTNSRG
ncbi:MAG: sensor histidine kinase [Eubacterium sp.]